MTGILSGRLYMILSRAGTEGIVQFFSYRRRDAQHGFSVNGEPPPGHSRRCIVMLPWMISGLFV